MSTSTKRDVIDAALGLAEDVSSGQLSPAALEEQLVAEVKALVGDVRGPDDPLFEVQVQIARGVLAAGGLSVDELAEWRSAVSSTSRSAPFPVSD